MLAVADAVARRTPQLFSWRCGAARRSTPRCASCTKTRGSACASLREKIPNICFQMLFRGSNAVGYSNYPDNVVAGFVKHAAAERHGYLPHFRFAQLSAEPESRDGSGAGHARHLRSRDLLHRRYSRSEAHEIFAASITSKLAKELEKMGAHFLAIKDMAGLCRPYAAHQLVKALKEEIGIPIHFHTHDTSGINAASRPAGQRCRRRRGRSRASLR